MRDPDRIKPLLKQIEAYWLDHPDLRLGQIISNANHIIRNNKGLPPDNDVFYIEDEDLSRVMRDTPDY